MRQLKREPPADMENYVLLNAVFKWIVLITAVMRVRLRFSVCYYVAFEYVRLWNGGFVVEASDSAAITLVALTLLLKEFDRASHGWLCASKCLLQSLRYASFIDRRASQSCPRWSNNYVDCGQKWQNMQ